MAGLGEVLAAFRPDAVVIAGAHNADDDVARWAYGVRSVSGALPVALFRRGARGRTTGAMVLVRSAERRLPRGALAGREPLRAPLARRFRPSAERRRSR